MICYRSQIEKYPIRHFSSKVIGWNYMNGGVIDMVLFQCYERTLFHPMPYASEKQNLIKPVSMESVGKTPREIREASH